MNELDKKNKALWKLFSRYTSEEEQLYMHEAGHMTYLDAVFPQCRRWYSQNEKAFTTNCDAALSARQELVWSLAGHVACMMTLNMENIPELITDFVRKYDRRNNSDLQSVRNNLKSAWEKTKEQFKDMENFDEKHFDKGYDSFLTKVVGDAARELLDMFSGEMSKQLFHNFKLAKMFYNVVEYRWSICSLIDSGDKQSLSKLQEGVYDANKLRKMRAMLSDDTKLSEMILNFKKDLKI